MKNLKEALNTISSGIDYLYEEEYPFYQKLAEAESVLYNLMNGLKRKGIVNLEDLEKLM